MLSFEHVPPRAAFNHSPRFRPVTKELIAHRVAGARAPSIVDEPRGAGAYTLCGDCNGRCARYARHFVDWAVTWQTVLDSTSNARQLTDSRSLRRSRIAKQIVAMFLSANPPKMSKINEGLRRFVWNATATGLPDGIRLVAALTRDKDARPAGVGRRWRSAQRADLPYSLKSRSRR